MQFRHPAIFLVMFTLAGCTPSLTVTQTNLSYWEPSRGDNIINALQSGAMTMDDIRLKEWLVGSAAITSPPHPRARCDS